jgi:hypothetical protein
VIRDKPHVSVGGLLGTGPFWGKDIFGEKSTKWEKENWKEKQHVRGKHARTHARKPNYIRVRVFVRYCNGNKPRICISKYLGGLGREGVQRF